MTAPADDDSTETDASDAGPIRHDWSSYDHPSTAIVDAVAATTGREPTEMPFLHDYVDTDELDTLLTTDGTDGGIRVWFTYVKSEVVVGSDGSIKIWPDSVERA